jgi:hypothetical protein
MASSSEDFTRLHRRIELALEENSEQRKEIGQLTEQMKLLNQRLKNATNSSQATVCAVSNLNSHSNFALVGNASLKPSHALSWSSRAPVYRPQPTQIINF